MQAVLGRSCRVGQETGQKGKGRSEAFRSFNGLVQPRMALTRRAFTPQPWSHRHRAPVNAILGRLAHFFEETTAFVINQKRCLAFGSELRTVLASVQCETQSTRPSAKDHRIVPVPLQAGMLPGPRFVTTCPSVIPFVIAAAFNASISSTRFVLGCLKSRGN